MNTYLVHSDTRRGRNQEYDGSVTFGNPVLGVITRTGRLEDTDSFLGAPGTIYSPRVGASGLELAGGQDWVELSADMLTVTMHFHTHGAVDEVRILESAVPEPGSLLLLGAGLLVLPLLRKRLQVCQPAQDGRSVRYGPDQRSSHSATRLFRRSKHLIPLLFKGWFAPRANSHCICPLAFVPDLVSCILQDMTARFHRAKLSAAERNFRSRIAQLASGQWLLRGTLSERSSKCGKPNCHCASGKLHKSVYLVQSHAGKLRQLCVPQAWRERVRQAVGDYHEMQRLLEEVSELEWKRLQERKP